MAIPRVTDQATETLPTVEEVMEHFGVDRYAASVYLAVKSGDALVDDLERISEGQREAVLRDEEENELALLSAAELVDPTATVEANVVRTGLDRRFVEAGLVLRRRLAENSLLREKTVDPTDETI